MSGIPPCDIRTRDTSCAFGRPYIALRRRSTLHCPLWHVVFCCKLLPVASAPPLFEPSVACTRQSVAFRSSVTHAGAILQASVPCQDCTSWPIPTFTPRVTSSLCCTAVSCCQTVSRSHCTLRVRRLSHGCPAHPHGCTSLQIPHCSRFPVMCLELLRPPLYRHSELAERDERALDARIAADWARLAACKERLDSGQAEFDASTYDRERLDIALVTAIARAHDACTRDGVGLSSRLIHLACKCYEMVSVGSDERMRAEEHDVWPQVQRNILCRFFDECRQVAQSADTEEECASLYRTLAQTELVEKMGDLEGEDQEVPLHQKAILLQMLQSRAAGFGKHARQEDKAGQVRVLHRAAYSCRSVTCLARKFAFDASCSILSLANRLTMPKLQAEAEDLANIGKSDHHGLTDGPCVHTVQKCGANALNVLKMHCCNLASWS